MLALVLVGKVDPGGHSLRWRDVRILDLPGRNALTETCAFFFCEDIAEHALDEFVDGPRRRATSHVIATLRLASRGLGVAACPGSPRLGAPTLAAAGERTTT